MLNGSDWNGRIEVLPTPEMMIRWKLASEHLERMPQDCELLGDSALRTVMNQDMPLLFLELRKLQDLLTGAN